MVKIYIEYGFGSLFYNAGLNGKKTKHNKRS